jgi:hypothetical protein
VTEPKSPLAVAFGMVEDALRQHNVVAIAFVDPETDEYDPRDKVVVTTWHDPESVPEEHDHASSLLVAFKRAGGQV